MLQPTPQREHALRRANSVRLERARIMRELRALPPSEGQLRAAELLMNVPAALGTMEVREFLGQVQRWGPRRVEQLLASLPVHGQRALVSVSKSASAARSLTERQRRLIAERLAR